MNFRVTYDAGEQFPWQATEGESLVHDSFATQAEAEAEVARLNVRAEAEQLRTRIGDALAGIGTEKLYAVATLLGVN